MVKFNYFRKRQGPAKARKALKFRYNMSRKNRTQVQPRETSGTRLVLYNGMLPDTMMVKLKYVDTITLTATGGTPQKYTFAGNSCYDPDVTGSGHQPMGFDQWVNFYSSYCVTGSSIVVKALSTNASSVTNVSARLILLPSLANTSLTMDQARELPYSQSKVFQYTGGTAVLKSFKRTSKMFSKSKDAITDDDTFSAAYNNNPASLWYWHVLANNINEANDATVQFEVTLNYYVKFTNRIQLAES